MKENEIPAGANRGKKRLGRGEGNGHGKTCCRGHKGAGARSGYSLRPGFEGGQMPLFRKLPRRGFNRTRFQTSCAIVNLSDLPRVSGEKVDLESLKEAGLIRPNSKMVKLLGTGEVDKAYQVDVTAASKSAKEKIEAAGGSLAVASD
ncbi:MAG TPA: 50S ribosomal protein L15 [Opitutae bacterium]|nr:50S ribosomal protein L15 [Opitutae bacterium]|tara:strand:- start:1637 stop:2077 length:441 start_codon:yes stop_codon:yes gene_type:complete